MSNFPKGTLADDWAHREEILKAWHEQHKRDCPDCGVDAEDGRRGIFGVGLGNNQ